MTTETKLPTPYQEFIHKSRYARWIPEKNKRESWDETVTRYTDYFSNKFPHFPKDEVQQAILGLEVMPSMRALMTAGPALERDPMAGFNCSFVAVDDVRAFDEILYILMCGTGVGFTVEQQYIAKLPTIAEEFHSSNVTLEVKDSKAGWASAFKNLLALLYAGSIPNWDVSKVRPKGSPLKTFGGRASGPEPLVDLFKFAIEMFQRAAGRQLNSLECNDLVCKIADIVVVGGVRRSALISLSDLSNKHMADAKSIYNVDQYSLVSETDTHKVYTITMKRNQPVHPTYRVSLKKGTPDINLLELQKKVGWWNLEGQRALANNSAAYTERPQMTTFLKEWTSLIESNSGERGIFNRAAAIKKAEESGRRDATKIVGTNPCAEISLRSGGLCNLTEVVIRAEDTLDDLLQKVRIATILGTYQSMLTDFRYVRKIWAQNQKEERLLGVSLTGILDHPVLSQTDATASFWLTEMKAEAIKTNKEWADKLGIPQAAAITTVKPSGTVSQLVDSASGIHPRYSEYYLRTVRADKKDPLAQMMRAEGFPVEDAQGKEDSTDVFYFPVKGPKHAVFRNDRTAIEQLEHYLMFQKYWSEHNVSNTIYVKPHEWLAVGDWVYQNFDYLAGVSFLPHSDHSYAQAPYNECDEQTYLEFLAKMPEMDWEKLAEYEKDDSTVNTKELACTAGGCEII